MAPLRAASATSPSRWMMSHTLAPTAHTRGSFMCVVIQNRPLRWHSSSIALLVTVAARGRPAPSVLLSVRMSGTTPSRSNANMAPVRPRPVCASSTIRSMPRASHPSLSARR